MGLNGRQFSVARKDGYRGLDNWQFFCLFLDDDIPILAGDFLAMRAIFFKDNRRYRKS